MIRMLGVLCGAAIAIALLTWLVGVPQFTQERTSVPEQIARVELPGTIEPADEPATDTVPEAVVDARPEAASGSTPEQADSEQTRGLAVQDVVAARIDPGPAASPDVDAADAGAATQAGFTALEPDAVPTTAPAETEDSSKWFAFWSPFRSELAANGFVSRLQSVTGLDYRVVRVKPGVYEVAFAYTDDDEIDAKLATISSATGLKLAGTP